MSSGPTTTSSNQPTGWKNFVAATKDRKPIAYLAEAAQLQGNSRGPALDIGCGAGVDARRLAELGYTVTAIDTSPQAVRTTRSLCRGLPVTVATKDIRNLRLAPSHFKIVLAWNSLLFLDKHELLVTLTSIEASLATGGIFVYSLFGPNDDWASRKGHISVITANEFRGRLKGMTPIEIRESWRDEPTAAGSVKHWHKIQGLARKI